MEKKSADALRAVAAPGGTRPRMLYWRCRHVILTSCLGALVDHGPPAGRKVIRREYIPHGADAWSLDGTHWTPLDRLPPAWGLRPLSGKADHTEEVH